MAMRDEDIGAATTLIEADGGLWSPPLAAPVSEPRDWRSLYEQAQARAETERARADSAEARCEELRLAEKEAHSRAGSLKWNLDRSRDKLKAAAEEVKEVRGAAKDALFFQAEVGRLEKLLSEAGVDSHKRSTIVSLRRPKRPAQASPPRRASAELRKALERARKQKDTIKALRGEIRSLSRETRRLRREQEQLQDLKATARRMTAEAKLLRGELSASLEARIIQLRSSRSAGIPSITTSTPRAAPRPR